MKSKYSSMFAPIEEGSFAHLAGHSNHTNPYALLCALWFARAWPLPWCGNKRCRPQRNNKSISFQFWFRFCSILYISFSSFFFPFRLKFDICLFGRRSYALLGLWKPDHRQWVSLHGMSTVVAVHSSRKFNSTIKSNTCIRTSLHASRRVYTARNYLQTLGTSRRETEHHFAENVVVCSRLRSNMGPQHSPCGHWTCSNADKTSAKYRVRIANVERLSICRAQWTTSVERTLRRNAARAH